MSAVRVPERTVRAPRTAAPNDGARRRRGRPRLRPVSIPNRGERRWPLVVLSAVVIGVLLMAIVATQALVNQTSFKMRDLQSGTKALRQNYAQLRLLVADLSAPERIVEEARALGLRLPDGMDVHLLKVPGGSGGSTTEDPTSFRLKELIGEHP